MLGVCTVDLCDMEFDVYLPASRLVDALCDEVGWERIFKLLLVLEGVVRLGVRHAKEVKRQQRIGFMIGC